MNPQAQIVEFDQERDRKTCIKLFANITGAERELAQWLKNHPRYSGAEVARWLGVGATKIKELRSWAARDFQGKHYTEKSPKFGDAALTSKDNSEDGGDGAEAASPEEFKDNIIDTLERQKAVALAYRKVLKVLKVSSLDEATKDEVSAAIGGLITIWQSLQRALRA